MNCNSRARAIPPYGRKICPSSQIKNYENYIIQRKSRVNVRNEQLHAAWLARSLQFFGEGFIYRVLKEKAVWLRETSQFAVPAGSA